MQASNTIQEIILLNKKEGETPLAALENFRTKNAEYKNEPITYAGRLDPMASGLLLLLVGEKAKEKEKFLALPKEYDFTVLFGFTTDTYDILGKVSHTNILTNVGMSSKGGLVKKIQENLKHFTGRFRQKYPMYSSKTVKGKPLFLYARAGEEVEIPSREVSVKKLKFLKIRKISSKKLLENIEKRVGKVKGDFRQKEIVKIWQKNLRSGAHEFFIADFKIKCGSGTYVRGIADALGKKISIPALALTIKRTKIGKYKLGQ